MEPRVTLGDVARAAGVSQATASRAINGSANRVVRPELRERVIAAAARLGYAPDANAQAVARGRTTSLGLVVHDIADPYYASLAAGVTVEAETEGLLVTLADTRFSSVREAEIVQMLDRQRVVAIVLAGTRLGDEEYDARLAAALRAYVGRGGRVATVAHALEDLPAVRIDNAWRSHGADPAPRRPGLPQVRRDRRSARAPHGARTGRGDPSGAAATRGPEACAGCTRAESSPRCRRPAPPR